jgi:hypothetical protein
MFYYSIGIFLILILSVLKIYDLFKTNNIYPKKLKQLLELGNIDKVHIIVIIYRY